MKNKEMKTTFKRFAENMDYPGIDELEELRLLNDNKYFEKINNLYSEIKPQNKISDDKIKLESFDEAARRVELDSQAIETFCKVIKEDTKIKKIYSSALIIMLVIELFMVNFVFIEIGLDRLHYDEITLNIFISGTLIEILGLVTIIVNYLFKDNITKALEKILVNNKSNK